MFRFKKWRIYNEARELRLDVHKKLIPKLPKEEQSVLIPQIRRAIDSIILNIAEGAYRKSDKDFAHFLNQSLGSLYEFVSTLDLLLDSNYINKDEQEDFCKRAEILAKQINAFKKSLRKYKA